jgi:hypothetical protein
MANRPRSLAAATAAVGLSLLSACESAPKFPPACPSLSLLRDAADLTRYVPGGHDIRGLIVDGRITAVPATCAFDTPDKVRATLSVAFTISRGPLASDRGYALPYFVAVIDAGQIVDEADYTISGAFPPNIDTVRVSSRPINLAIPITKQKSAAAYQVYVGFRLSPEELAVNRQRGPR